MSSLSTNDRASLCSFTFSDGRRCRTPRNLNHPHFCFYHAQKEARATAAQKLGKDLAYFFSGDYLSACDLSTALARLIPAVVRRDVKPKTAHTVAYLVQTLMQAIHISEDEYINASARTAGANPPAIPLSTTTTTASCPPPNRNRNRNRNPPSQEPKSHNQSPPSHRTRLNPPLSLLFPHLAASHNLTLSQLSSQFVRCTQASAHVAPASNASAHQPSKPADEPSQHPFANNSTHSATPAVHPKSRPLRSALRPQLPPLHRRQTLLESTLA